MKSPVSGLRFRDIGSDDGAAEAVGERAGFFVVGWVWPPRAGLLRCRAVLPKTTLPRITRIGTINRNLAEVFKPHTIGADQALGINGES